MISEIEMHGIQRLFKAILTQAIEDALYVSNKNDLKMQDKYEKNLKAKEIEQELKEEEYSYLLKKYNDTYNKELKKVEKLEKEKYEKKLKKYNKKCNELKEMQYKKYQKKLKKYNEVCNELKEKKYKIRIKKPLLENFAIKVRAKKPILKTAVVTKKIKKPILKNVKFPNRPNNSITLKRDALKWLYGHDKDYIWILELCCDICNVTKEQVREAIEKHHKNKENFFEKEH